MFFKIILGLICLTHNISAFEEDEGNFYDDPSIRWEPGYVNPKPSHTFTYPPPSPPAPSYLPPLNIPRTTTTTSTPAPSYLPPIEKSTTTRPTTTTLPPCTPAPSYVPPTQTTPELEPRTTTRAEYNDYPRPLVGPLITLKGVEVPHIPVYFPPRSGYLPQPRTPAPSYLPPLETTTTSTPAPSYLPPTEKLTTTTTARPDYGYVYMPPYESTYMAASESLTLNKPEIPSAPPSEKSLELKQTPVNYQRPLVGRLITLKSVEVPHIPVYFPPRSGYLPQPTTSTPPPAYLPPIENNMYSEQNDGLRLPEPDSAYLIPPPEKFYKRRELEVPNRLVRRVYMHRPRTLDNHDMYIRHRRTNGPRIVRRKVKINHNAVHNVMN